jgi:hypothetical protein
LNPRRLFRETSFHGGEGRIDPGLDGRHIGKLAMSGDADPWHAHFGATAVTRWSLPRAAAIVSPA